MDDRYAWQAKCSATSPLPIHNATMYKYREAIRSKDNQWSYVDLKIKI